MSSSKLSVPYVSPTKGSALKPNSPQMPSIMTSRDLLTRRVWVKRPDGNPTSIQVKESHLIDDLKMMIIDRFPTTLAKICDPSDVIIRLELNRSSSSPNYFNSPTTPSSNKKFIPPTPISASTGYTPLINSPLSPIPISTRQSSLIPPKFPNGDYQNITRNSVSPTVSALDPDKSVWNILDYYYPNGQNVENAFIVEIPPSILSQLSSPYQSSLGSSIPRKSLSTETIAEIKEDDTFTATPPMRRLSSTSSVVRSNTPNAHRRTQSNPAEHAAAVLLLPSSSTDPWKKGLKRSSTDISKLKQSTSFNSEDQSNDTSSINSTPPSHIKNKISDAASISSGRSTMAKVLPSINVLIVEDNLINLRILATHLKRHRIHYEVAKNGKEAIDKWRNGGFHLVLMDIQLPVMSGLDASREIRRLEKINHIGVFANSDLQNLSSKKEEDELDLSVFRAPVIIVALTASNLKQDKQEALSAGCNDYLTKPVNLDWLLNKITEWGCMQALIDFDGWKSGERMTNISAAIPNLTRKGSSNVSRSRSTHVSEEKY